MSSHSLKSRLEKLKPQLLTTGKKQEKSSCKVRRDAPECRNSEPPKPEQEGPTAIVDRSPRYEPVSQNEKEHNHAPGVVCPACEKRKEMRATLSAEMPFSEAAESYINLRTINVPSGRVRYVSDRTLCDYRAFRKALNIFFGNLKLSDIHAGSMSEYQELRANGGNGNGMKWPQPAGANKIIKELGFLIRIKKLAGSWSPEIERGFCHLQHVRSEIGYALTPTEQDHWLHICSDASRFKGRDGGRLLADRWRFILCYSYLAIAIAARTKELRSVRVGDIDTVNHIVTIRAVTSKMRIPRTAPIPDEIWWAVEWLSKRARDMGATLPQHYLFPVGRGNGYDPAYPMTVSGIKKPWQEVCKFSGVKWRPSDTRHTGFTRMAEAGTPIHVMMAIGGHIRREMQDAYIHICEQSKRLAVSRSHRKPIQSSYPQGRGNGRGEAASV